MVPTPETILIYLQTFCGSYAIFIPMTFSDLPELLTHDDSTGPALSRLPVEVTEHGTKR